MNILHVLTMLHIQIDQNILEFHFSNLDHVDDQEYQIAILMPDK